MGEPILIEAGEALAVLGAAGIEARLEGPATAAVSSACVDSRKAGPGSLFAALPGERADGHDYAAAALAAGASLLLLELSRPEVLPAPALAAHPGAALLRVRGVLPALQAIARARRLKAPRAVRIGVTGSSGKTTTKELIAAILSRGSRVAVNPGNLNSDQGLPMSMFGLGADADYGVFEMGMNRRGEIAEIAAVLEPDYALVTNVGTAHIGILGSRDAIAAEKKAVFSRFNGSQTGFVWEDDDYNAFLREGTRGEVLDFGPRSTKGFRGAEDLGLDGWAVDWEGLRIRFPLAGRHNLLDALAAISLAARVGTRPAEVAEGLESARPLFGRSEIIRGEVTVIRDCYNANPESVEAALGFCDSLSWPGRRAYVLGSMRELGEGTEAAHRAMGKAAARSRATALFFFGDETRSAFEEARASGFPGLILFETDIDRLGAAVRAWKRAGDLFLLKASRGIALERLADHLGT